MIKVLSGEFGNTLFHQHYNGWFSSFKCLAIKVSWAILTFILNLFFSLTDWILSLDLLTLLVIKMSASNKLIDTVLRKSGFDALFDFHGKVSSYFFFGKSEILYRKSWEAHAPFYLPESSVFITFFLFISNFSLHYFCVTQKSSNSGLDFLTTRGHLWNF